MSGFGFSCVSWGDVLTSLFTAERERADAKPFMQQQAAAPLPSHPLCIAAVVSPPPQGGAVEKHYPRMVMMHT